MLLTEENEQHGAHIQRSMQVYKRMKRITSFLQVQNDYPLAVLLAGQSENVETLTSCRTSVSETSESWFA